MNQTALGARIGLGRSSLSNVEAGRQRPSLHTLIAAAQALQVDLEQLVGGPGVELPDLTVQLPEPTETARPFYLQRAEDVTGVSGTGVIAHGVQFPDGVTVLRWVTGKSTTAVWDSLEDALAVHGHDGRTRAVFLDGLE